METKVLSSLEKVFENKAPEGKELAAFSLLKNEKGAFQVVGFADKAKTLKSVDVEGFDGNWSAFLVGSVPSELPCFEHSDDYYITKEPGLFPDVLYPIDGGGELPEGKWFSVWVELDPAEKAAPGKKQLTVTLDFGDEKAENTVEVEVINALLPKQSLIHTNWYHSDGLARIYGAPPFTEKFWKITENFVRAAAAHGINCLLTPLFTPPLDTAVGHERMTVQLVDVKVRGSKYSFNFTKLKRWIDMCRKCGIEYFEMSHLFTQWGAKHAPKIVAKDRKNREKVIFGWFTRPHSHTYDSFLLQLGQALIPFLEREGVRERCFFHVSDEPGMDHLKTYKRRAALIRKAFPGFTVIDALSDLDFYKNGCVEQPIPGTGSAEEFSGVVPSLWTYYCCGQGREYLSNRFMAMPSERTRVLGFQLYRFDVKGFLQWGYNFYNTQYSLAPADPFKVTDAGGHFPSGDSFVVYPGENGEPIISLRLKVFYEALQDQRALQLLESLAGKEEAVKVLEEGLDTPLTFRDYPHSADWLLETRERINAAIKARS